MSLSPTQRTIKELKAQGFDCGIVEKWNAYAKVRQDLFGIIDILALDPERGFIGVQCTGSDYSGHLRKLTEEKAQECLNWIKTPGGVLELWAWRKVKVKKGGKAMIWKPRIKIFTLEDFEASEEDISSWE